MSATIYAVAASGADVGVMLDCDVDRCGLIDGISKPEPVNRTDWSRWRRKCFRRW